MPQEHPGSAAPYGAGNGPGERDYESIHDEPDDPGWPVALPPGARFPVGEPSRRVSRATLAAVAVLVLTAAAAVALVATDRGSPSPPAATAPGGPGGGGNGGGGLVNGGAGGNGSRGLLMAGRVTAVSSTSITLGGGAQGHVVTAAFTTATQFDGRAKSASAIKVGDTVMVRVAGYGSARPTVSSVTDPARTR